MRAADVIVVGAGLAGHCAAIEAAAAGASVLLLEKQPEVGGSTVLSGGSFAFAGTAEQAATGIRDSNELLFRDMREVGGHENDERLVALYVDHQLDAYRWLKGHGVTFGPVQAASGQSVPRQHPANPREVIRLLAADAGTRPAITLRTGVRVVRLVRDAATRRVTGVLVEEGGRRSELQAARGVVLTSGGFSRNEALLKAFVPHQAKANRVGGPGNTGDGLLMGWELGAGFRDMPWVKGTFGNRPDARPEEHTAMLAVYKGAIAVNLRGERFVDESVSYKLMGDAVLEQPDARGFQVFDQTVMERTVPGVPIYDFQRRIDEGSLIRAESIEELAAKTKLSLEGLRTTLAAYNRDCAAGKDSRFGRTSLSQGNGALTPIERAPFYAYPSGSAIIATYCGLTVDPELRVLDVFGAPIEGLHAAGEVTGGFHGVAFMTGTSLGKSTICGRIAGRNAAAA